jgi:hypothetical protein
MPAGNETAKPDDPEPSELNGLANISLGLAVMSWLGLFALSALPAIYFASIALARGFGEETGGRKRRLTAVGIAVTNIVGVAGVQQQLIQPISNHIPTPRP